MELLTDCPQKLARTCFDPSDAIRHPLSDHQRPLAGALQGETPLLTYTLGCSKGPGSRRSHLVVIDESPASQFDAMLEALNAGVVLPDGSAAIGLTGQRFHGQRDRAWAALEGNLHLTVYYHLNRAAQDLGMGLTMLPTLSIMDALAAQGMKRTDLGIKWVNDIFIGSSKTAGVLTATQSQGGLLRHVVFGLGVNIAATPKIEATPSVPSATCLNDAFGTRIDLFTFLDDLLECIDLRYRQLLADGPEQHLQDYRNASLILGREVLIWEEEAGAESATRAASPPTSRGRITAINPDLSLQLSGRNTPVTRGRLAFPEACGQAGI